MRTRGHYRWYFVCSNCEAKAFATKAFIACPRCGASLESTEMQKPPWLKHAHDKESPLKEYSMATDISDVSLARTVVDAVRHAPEAYSQDINSSLARLGSGFVPSLRAFAGLSSSGLTRGRPEASRPRRAWTGEGPARLPLLARF